MALQGSVRQNHGFLPHASRPGGAAVGDLHWLPEAQTMGRRIGGGHFYFCPRGRDDRFLLGFFFLLATCSGNPRSACALTRRAPPYCPRPFLNSALLHTR